MSSLVCRFAPSPNGYLHLGHALSALMNFDMARATGGRGLLRIQGIDPGRRPNEIQTASYEEMAWVCISLRRPRPRGRLGAGLGRDRIGPARRDRDRRGRARALG